MSEVFVSKHLDYQKIAIDVVASPAKKNCFLAGLTANIYNQPLASDQ